MYELLYQNTVENVKYTNIVLAAKKYKREIKMSELVTIPKESLDRS